MPRYLSPETVRKVQLTALANGGQLRCFSDGTPSSTVEWDIAGRCQKPVKVELHGRASKGNEKMINVTPTDNRPNFVEMDVRCRKCPSCLAQRSYMWSMRAKAEFGGSGRTWLATLTLAPEQYAKLLSIARVRLAKQGCDLEAMPDAEQWLLVEAPGYENVKLWLKRLRKTYASPMRFLAVTEAHKSGLPHWHVLIHEHPERHLRYKKLKDSWPHGFASYKLVENTRGAAYVCKYLSKEMRARVRASLRYGEGFPLGKVPDTPS